MAKLALTPAEIIEVRQLVSVGATPTAIPDVTITSEVYLGAASDYVYERVLERTDLTGEAFESLTQDEKDAVTRARDETAEDITNFINVVLKPPQRLQFRRAVMFRTAGLIVEGFPQRRHQRLVDFVESFTQRDWVQHRIFLFAECDREIQRIGKSFAGDIFPEFDFAKLSVFTLANG